MKYWFNFRNVLQINYSSPLFSYIQSIFRIGNLNSPKLSHKINAWHKKETHIIIKYLQHIIIKCST